MTTRNSRDDEDHTPDPRTLAKRLSNRHLINGQLAPSIAGKTFDVIYPATLEVIAQAAFGEEADVEAAVAAAQQAQKSWGAVPARERGKLVAECGQRLEAHKEELARLVALETGKALRTESRVEAGVLADAQPLHHHPCGAEAGECRLEQVEADERGQ